MAGIDYRPDEDAGRSRAQQVLDKHSSELLGREGVRGVGVTRSGTGQEAIVVYVIDGHAASQLPRQIDGVEVCSEVTGEIDAL